MTEWLEAKRGLVVELFALSNLAFLALDILIAHSVNRFGEAVEWLPFGFSIGGSLVLVVALMLRDRQARLSSLAIRGVAWASIAVGLGGFFLHLEGQFFQLQSVQSLVYSAPLAAPLAYAGIGLLLLLNHYESVGTPLWSAWLVFLALGGFVGNFALALLDHAQNGFFLPSEWVPVVSSALAIGFLTTALWERSNAFYRVTLAVLAAQVLVGLVGFGLHFLGASRGGSETSLQAFIHGAPIFAPLLFANLALLGGLGVWSQQRPRLAEPGVALRT